MYRVFFEGGCSCAATSVCGGRGGLRFSCGHGRRWFGCHRLNNRVARCALGQSEGRNGHSDGGNLRWVAFAPERSTRCGGALCGQGASMASDLSHIGLNFSAGHTQNFASVGSLIYAPDGARLCSALVAKITRLFKVDFIATTGLPPLLTVAKFFRGSGETLGWPSWLPLAATPPSPGAAAAASSQRAEPSETCSRRSRTCWQTNALGDSTGNADQASPRTSSAFSSTKQRAETLRCRPTQSCPGRHGCESRRGTPCGQLTQNIDSSRWSARDACGPSA